MTITELNGQSVCILGFGREGQASLRAIEQYAPEAQVTIADSNEALQITNRKSQIVNLQIGSNYLDNLERFDLIIKTPGIPPQPEFDTIQDKLTNSTQIFIDTARTQGSLIIGVTGSKGKSTTATLIHDILKAAEMDVYLVGNIGVPTLDFLDRAKSNTIFVQEMSSAQLMDLTTSPHIAVVTSFFPEHLDYHGSIDAYMEAKKHITKFQTEADYVFFSAVSDGARKIAEASPGIHVACARDDSVVRLDETRLIGEHNLHNLALASIVGEHFQIPKDTVRHALMEFTPLPHRLQSLGVQHGIEWVDDAISTTPESAIAAIQALGDRVQTIILGGQDRGNDFTELGQVIAESNIKHIILFPESGERIKTAIENAGANVTFFDAQDMETAVSEAKNVTHQASSAPPSPSPIVLLSTASPSYNMFKDFEEKGETFKECVMNQTC